MSCMQPFNLLKHLSICGMVAKHIFSGFLKKRENLLQLTLMNNYNLYKTANMICTNLNNFGCTKLYNLKIDLFGG